MVGNFHIHLMLSMLCKYFCRQHFEIFFFFFFFFQEIGFDIQCKLSPGVMVSFFPCPNLSSPPPLPPGMGGGGVGVVAGDRNGQGGFFQARGVMTLFTPSLHLHPPHPPPPTDFYVCMTFSSSYIQVC